MDVASLVSGTASADMIRQLTGVAQAHDAAGASIAVLDQVLDVQQQLAAQLLQSMGVGGSLDLFV